MTNGTKETMSFEKVRASIDAVVRLRRLAWEKIRRVGNDPTEDGKAALAQRLPRICVLASSSRGGTSVTAELLQWQGADCTDPRGRLLTLPGEEKPHLILAGFAFPARAERFDDLTEADVHAVSVSSLLEEIRSEIGYPMAECDDLERYATQLYRRLLLQWPISLTGFEMEDAIVRLSQALRVTFPQGYRDSVDNRRQVLAACIRCFPFIRPSFYDCSDTRTVEDLVGISCDCWSIEETPFVLPPPWCNATTADLEQGSFLLRDPSNAWRLPFWRAVFPAQRIDVLHLVRDPRESVQGLCDGWNYPFGFQTMPSDETLGIHSYSDSPDRENAAWKKRRLNFSINRSLSRKLLDEHQQMSLVEVCARQWKDAHECILAEAARLGLSHTVVSFADLRNNAEKTFRQICASVRLECSPSGLAYAQSFPDRWVMATTLVKPAGHDRWKSSPFSAEIRALASSGYFDEVGIQLGLGRISSNEIDSPPDDGSVGLAEHASLAHA